MGFSYVEELVTKKSEMIIERVWVSKSSYFTLFRLVFSYLLTTGETDRID